MRIFKYTILLIAMLLSTHIKAQLPVNDSAWVLQTALSDEFHGTSLDGSKWYQSGNGGVGISGNVLTYNSNVTVQNDTVSIKLDTLFPAVTVGGKKYHYQSGAFISDGNAVYKYGYLEMYARVPSGNYAYWPAFWLEDDTCSYPTISKTFYNEIDILENSSIDSQNGNVFGCNWHVY